MVCVNRRIWSKQPGACRQDYETKEEQMIYGDADDFNSLIEKLRSLQEKFRVKSE